MVDWAYVNGMGDEHDHDESLFARGTGDEAVGSSSSSDGRTHPFSGGALRNAEHVFAGSFMPAAFIRAQKRGWSMYFGPYATQEVPRVGSPWNTAEERDLLKKAPHVKGLSELAERHGRSENAIRQRLEQLGYDRHVLAAADFAELELRVISHIVSQNLDAGTYGEQAMQMTNNRLFILTAASMGILNSLPNLHHFFGRDMAVLHANGLLDAKTTIIGGDSSTVYSINEAGQQFVASLLGHAVAKNEGASSRWDNNRQSSVLDDKRFFLVASGDCQKMGGGPGGTKPRLTNPPQVVHESQKSAEAEAKRLAELNRGMKLFVLQAVTVHCVPEQPATSRKL